MTVVSDSVEAERSDIDEPIWRYVCLVYARPGVTAACLELQDQAGVDVIVLLAALFATDVRHLVMDVQAIAALDAHVNAWRGSVVIPLRTIRRALKASAPLDNRLPASALLQTIRDAELQAEQIELGIVSDSLAGLPVSSQKPNLLAAIEAVVRFYAPRLGDETAMPANFNNAVSVIAEQASTVENFEE